MKFYPKAIPLALYMCVIHHNTWVITVFLVIFHAFNQHSMKMTSHSFSRSVDVMAVNVFYIHLFFTGHTILIYWFRISNFWTTISYILSSICIPHFQSVLPFFTYTFMWLTNFTQNLCAIQFFASKFFVRFKVVQIYDMDCNRYLSLLLLRL